MSRPLSDDEIRKYAERGLEGDDMHHHCEDLERRVERLEDRVFEDDDSATLGKIVRLLREAGVIKDDD